MTWLFRWFTGRRATTPVQLWPTRTTATPDEYRLSALDMALRMTAIRDEYRLSAVDASFRTTASADEYRMTAAFATE